MRASQSPSRTNEMKLSETNRGQAMMPPCPPIFGQGSIAWWRNCQVALKRMRFWDVSASMVVPSCSRESIIFLWLLIVVLGIAWGGLLV